MLRVPETQEIRESLVRSVLTAALEPLRRGPWGRGASERLLLKTVGPMLVPDQRVLVVGANPAQALRECRRRGVEAFTVANRQAEEPEAFDLVLVLPLRQPSVSGELEPLIRAAEELLGESGRLLMAGRVSAAPDALRHNAPRHYRSRLLAQRGVLGAAWAVWSLGWDAEAARAERHRARGLRRTEEQRVGSARRRWVPAAVVSTVTSSPETEVER